MTADPTTLQRKRDHIQINLEQDVRARETTTGFEHYRLLHVALPELDLRRVDLTTTFLGRKLKAPILISSMTGGVAKGAEINRRLAVAAEALGCAMGVGSQRAAIEDPSTSRHFSIREVAPTALIFANLGAVQLNYGFGIQECRRAVEMIEADALILHLNPLQEALQGEGNRDFSNLLGKIADVCAGLEAPVIVKEIGSGISEAVARQLANAGVAAIDVGGAGGTSWSAVEHHRAESALTRRLSETFVDWGIPTASSLLMAQAGAPGLPIIASGGLQTGLDAAKAIGLGAALAGFAGPLLRAAAESQEETMDILTALIEELRLAMFCAGAGSLAGLRDSGLLDQRIGRIVFPPPATKPTISARPARPPIRLISAEGPDHERPTVARTSESKD
jgi:isopentenyl-diphosphate Delta-isomerase